MDLGKEAGVHYLIGADRYSGWPFVSKLSSLVTKAITDALDEWFLEHGRPQRIRSDGGPQFKTEFNEWCERRGIIHELSSAYHHQSNGHAEVTVREMKHLIEKSQSSWTKFKHALLEWRNTPRHNDKFSPAQYFLGRRQRTEVAALPEAFKRVSNENLEEAEALRGERREATKERVASCAKSELSVGDKVLVQHWRTLRWDLAAEIIEKRNSRSYVVESEYGKRYLRNRKFLKPNPLPEPREETAVERFLPETGPKL